jgi:hypothetical protein
LSSAWLQHAAVETPPTERNRHEDQYQSALLIALAAGRLGLGQRGSGAITFAKNNKARKRRAVF